MMMKKSGDKMEDTATLIAMETKSDNNYGSITMDAPGRPRDRNVFRDGSTRVDFVLVWEEPLTSHEGEGGEGGSGSAHRKWREKYLKKLKQAGLLVEEDQVLQQKKKICFLLLSAPWNLLCYYAEEISLRAPLQVVDSVLDNDSERLLRSLSLPNPMAQVVPNPPPDYYTCQFRTNKLPRFLGSDNHETFFKTTQRHQVLYEILARTAYGSTSRGEVGIDRLINEGVFTAAYPLHEGDFEQPTPPVPPDCLGLRQILNLYWAQWSCWRRYQPLDHIREYFGEKIALYFAWLGFYTAWLLPAAIVGTVVFLFGFWLMATDIPAKTVCDSANDFIMCPMCNICTYWNYSSICSSFKLGILFDNGGTVFLSVFMSLWAVTFLEYWKRKCSILSHHWDCSEFMGIEERPRPEFTAMAPMTMRNPVTGAEEPYFPENQRFNRTVTGCMVIIVMMFVVIMFLLAIILYRCIIRLLIFHQGAGLASFIDGKLAGLSGSVLNLVVILLLTKVYTSLAHILTRWEMHRTQTKYEDMFILKVFIFQFVNFYSTPIYIAFFKGRFLGYPGNYQNLFGVPNEDCGAGGCLIELAQELLVIMVGKQLINNVQEFLGPKVKAWWVRRKLKPHVKKDVGEETQKEEVMEEVLEEEKVSPWMADYELLVCEGLFDEYLEMVIQFGFITIFVAACPLAPLFALVNNWVEIRLDAQKFVTEYRRPVAERAQDIGIWLPILQFITHVAVLSNAFLIAFTSSFVPRMFYRYTRDYTMHGFVNFTLATAPRNYTEQHDNIPCRYSGYRDENGKYLPEFYILLAARLAFVIVFEHIVFTIGHMIDLMVPDVPEEVEVKMKREHYMAKEALAENQSLGKASSVDDLMSGELRHRGSQRSDDSSTPDPKPDENHKDV